MVLVTTGQGPWRAPCHDRAGHTDRVHGQHLGTGQGPRMAPCRDMLYVTTGRHVEGDTGFTPNPKLDPKSDAPSQPHPIPK